ncbi:hypothetical protein BN381_110069 [Candidatus Microthrix parvicella RN1]|uniref:Uncharacterized protein n=1 Tax=Candidatus Neomicrothrix parvicella RN1 TaxID=1229780 RepID=R4YWL9_9ACTN|nr:hypothetical protein BN381_110069 [Candidatus Microthrix parvicella RN1]
MMPGRRRRSIAARVGDPYPARAWDVVRCQAFAQGSCGLNSAWSASLPDQWDPARTRWVERVTRIELAFSAWEADVLPLNYTREGL